MFFVGAAVVEVAPVDVEVEAAPVGLTALGLAVVGGARGAVPESNPPPHDATTKATQQRLTANRRPLTGWTLPVSPRSGRYSKGPRADGLASNRAVNGRLAYSRGLGGRSGLSRRSDTGATGG